MELTGLFALAVAVGAVVLVVRGWDVRLVLLAAALLIAAGSSFNEEPANWYKPLAAVVREFLGTFSNEKFVVPICSAMGFAYVLRHTGCERHLVLVLVRPLRRVRWLLVPGVVVVGFLVNIPVISQTSTAVCIGPVVVPLMRAAGYSMPTVGACLLLGASVGGELLNPGAPELLTVEAATHVSTIRQAHTYLPPLVFTQLAVSVVVIWLMSLWWERAASRASHGTGSDVQNRNPPVLTGGSPDDRINLLKALVPVVPIALLFATGMPERYKLFHVPEEWVVKPEDAKQYSSRLIGLAMLVGVLVAAAVAREKARDCVKQFFEGAGYGFAVIVSLIVTANCFGVALKGAGLERSLEKLIADAPGLMQPLAAFVPLAFAALSGSGMASTQSLYSLFHKPAVDLGLDPVSVGALVSLGSAAGRTMSPVAAVTLMCATMTGTNPFALAKRVAVPLLVGIAVVVGLRMGGVL
jgi:DcuC family C4-dicarboxylate transporter